MAFGVKYRMEWTDHHRGDDFKLDILRDGYVSSVIDLGHSSDAAFELNYTGSEWVQGLEGVFSFIVNEDDVEDYDADFYNSFYKELKIKFYINGTLKNVGWIKPENTTREYLEAELLYRVSFTDGLNDLKDVNYAGFKEAGNQTILQVIKNALEFNGIDDLDFLIQCNLYEDQLMSASDNLFKELSIRNKAFYNVDNGEPTSDKCFEVLEKCVKSFYCTISQVNGYWQIINGAEYASFRDVYSYSTLAAVSEDVAYDRQLSIADYHTPAGSKWELSKIPPIKILRVIWRNANSGDNELVNGDFASGDLTGWSNGVSPEDWTIFQVLTSSEEGGNYLRMTTFIPTGNPNLKKSFKTDPFFVASIGDGSGFFECTFKMTLQSVSYISGSYLSHPPNIQVRLTYPDGSHLETPYFIVQQGTKTYQTLGAFPVTQTGDHFFEIFYIPNSGADFAAIALNFDDIILTQSATAGTSFDVLYINTSEALGYLEEEEELYLLDGPQISDVGIILQGSDTTSSWTRYGLSVEGQPLGTLFAQQYLNDRQAFHDIIVIELLDLLETINRNTILLLDSKQYEFTEFSKNYSTKIISGTIQQVDNA